MREAGAEVVPVVQVYIAMDGYIQPATNREVQVSWEEGCRERPWTHLRRLLQQIPGINDVFPISLNSYSLFIFTG